MHTSSLLVLACVLATHMQMHAQTYTYTQTQGRQEYTANIRPNSTLIMKGPSDDVLSSWQTLPFSWSFYGSPVTGYYASDNGYVTFDAGATASVPANIASAESAQPNNAIYAYWEDLHFTGGMPTWSNEIRTITIGTAPERAHVIMWISAVPPGVEASSSNTLSFAIALKESGGFDIIYIAGQKTVRSLTGSAGCENADGSVASWIAGSPDIDYPLLTASADDDLSWHFTYSDSRYDLAVTSTILPRKIHQFTSTPVAGTLRNLGSKTVTSLDLHYSADGGPSIDMTVTGISLPSSGTYAFTFPGEWTAPAAGSFSTMRIWTSNINGTEPDEQPSNDTLTARVFTILGMTTPRRVLVEEFTGAWCGWCPDGSLQMQNLEKAYPDMIPVSIHAGGIDAMICSAGENIATAFTPAYPQVMVDRVKFAGQTGVPISRGNSAWFIRTAERRAVPAHASLSLRAQYDSAARRATVDVEALYVDYGYPGETRLHVFVVEDRVTGDGSGYDQANYYSGNTSYPNHPYFSESNPIKGFVHRHVLRASLTGTWGDASVIPAAPQANQTYAASYSYTVSSSFNEKEIAFVAFLSDMGSGLDQREVINAASTPLLPRTTFINILPSASGMRLQVHPNPAVGPAEVALEIPSPQRIHLSVIDAVGRMVSVIADRAVVPGTLYAMLPDLKPGVYRVVARTKGEVTVRPLVILR